MVQGVNFTPSAAGRISDAVKKIESLPSETNTQRRRAGGLGRMTLWEVTAVQTTPKTVTIKRVETQAGVLIDASQKEDVLYDLANEPSVEDQGLLVRLGEGSLFFFSKAKQPTDTDVVKFSEYSYVSNQDEQLDTNFGHPNTALVQRITDTDPANNNQLRGILKFEREIIGTEDLFTHIILGWRRMMLLVIRSSTDAILAGHFALKVFKITADFDASAVTFNNYASLPKTLVSDFTQFRLTGFSTESHREVKYIAAHGTPEKAADLSIIRTVVGYYRFNLSNSFGLTLEIDEAFGTGQNRRMFVWLEKAGATGTTPLNAIGGVLRMFAS